MAKAKPNKKATSKKSKPVAKKVSKPVKKAAPKSKKTVKPVKAAKAVAKKKLIKKTVVKTVKKVAAKIAPKAKKAAPKKIEIIKPKVTGNKATAKPVISNIVKPKATNGVKPLQKVKMKKEPANELNLRYSDEELREFKDLIDKKLIAAREELKNLKEALDNHTESQVGNKAWNMEEGTDTSEMEYLMNQISRQHQYIRNLELAMIRVENKTYGICRVTGKLIPKERLRIVPHATLSLEAKMTRKNEETSPGASVTAPPADFSEGFED